LATRSSRSNAVSPSSESTSLTSSSGVFAILTALPYSSMTSAIPVDTTGLSAARYSSVFVGLM
jgi:hypothetical protein